MSGTLTVCQLQTNFPKAVKQDIEFSVQGVSMLHQ